jgi:hypothetical protein
MATLSASLTAPSRAPPPATKVVQESASITRPPAGPAPRLVELPDPPALEGALTGMDEDVGANRLEGHPGPVLSQCPQGGHHRLGAAEGAVAGEVLSGSCRGSCPTCPTARLASKARCASLRQVGVSPALERQRAASMTPESRRHYADGRHQCCRRACKPYREEFMPRFVAHSHPTRLDSQPILRRIGAWLP